MENLPIKIKVGPTAVESRIEIGGVDYSSFVRKVSFSAAVGDLTVVSVDFIKVEVEAEGEIAPDGWVDVTGMGDHYKQYVEAVAVRDLLDTKEGEA